MSSTRTARRARAAIPVVAALGLVFATVTPAAASPSLVTRSGAEVRFAALSGEANQTHIYSSGTELRVADLNGLTAGSGCVQLTPTEASCGAAASVTKIVGATGDLGDYIDVFDNLTIPADLNGGSGQDRVWGGGGNDRLTDPDGWASLPVDPSFLAGAGNDQIISRNGGFDRVDCGPGIDTVVADRVGTDVLANCEYVYRY